MDRIWRLKSTHFKVSKVGTSSVILLILTIPFFYRCHVGNPQPLDSSVFDPQRFVFEDLVSNLDEPMDLAFLDDIRILFIERRGILKLHNLQSKITRVVGQLDVNYINENGLLGMVPDPNYSSNNWIYLFYTDPIRKSYQNISRFTFIHDSLHNDTEIKLLDFYIDYDNCCHFGGNLAFGPEGHLFISSGDNVGGKDFAPIDERDGRFLHDAQRTSSNSNDLRGSIMRIKPKTDGTYHIPSDNLFKPNTPNARSEIYIMGTRNPLKIFVDQKTGWLFWGDVGPNPGHKFPSLGPPSYEEINLAKEAGNFGWPYFLADNKPFRDFDFTTEEPGQYFNPEKVINNSPNNTGLHELPPAQKALIWYPNLASDSFPLVGSGGGTACAGPVYHFNPTHRADHWPIHFDDKLLIYEWMRSWVLAVELDRSGRYLGMEEIFPKKLFKKPIDMVFGPDGALYVLDYGSNWYAQNADARLTRVSYQHGNRPPIAQCSADDTLGTSPFTVELSSEKSSDPDGDILSVSWFIDDRYVSNLTSYKHTFAANKNYSVRLLVKDIHGDEDSDTLRIRVGNAPPNIDLVISPNAYFFVPGGIIKYAVSIEDYEDGNTDDGQLDPERYSVTMTHLKNSRSVPKIRPLFRSDNPHFKYALGKSLLDASDCFACHHINNQSVGPPYLKIATAYHDQSGAIDKISRKIIEGGSGVWGEQLMPAHPQHSMHEAREMANYILSLADSSTDGQKIPQSGVYQTDQESHEDLYLLSATYMDNATTSQPSNTISAYQILRPPVIPAIEFDTAYRVVAKPIDDSDEYYAEVALNGCFIGFENVDLTGIHQIRIQMRSNAGYVEVEVRVGNSQGPVIAKKRNELEEREDKWAPFDDDDWFDIELDIPHQETIEDLYFVFYSDKKESDYIYFDICQLHSLTFLFQEI